MNNLFSNFLERGQELKKRLNTASKVYYGMKLDEGEVDESLGDKEYDRLYDEYVELEKQFPELRDENSPTIKIGATVVSILKKIKHLTPLLSITIKTKKEKDIRKWYRSVGGNGVVVLIQPKFDGLTVDVLFKTLMDYAATRGNGYIGEIITHNIRTIKSIPKKITYDGKLEVRGEGILYFSEFMEKWSDQFSNARNLAAGTLRQLDSSFCKEKNPDVIFYDIGVCDKSFKTDVEQLEFLKSQGFKTTPYICVDNEDDLVKVCLSRMNGMVPLVDGFNVLKTDSDVTDIMCDGLVLKVNDLELRKKIGVTQKGPKWAAAFKFESLKAITTLEDIEVNTTRIGKQAPTGIISPVNLGGVTIKRATLNNYDFINSLPLVDKDGNILQENYGVKFFDEVLIERSNDVIPKIIGVISRGKQRYDSNGNEINTNIEPPKYCKSCGGEIVKNGAHYFCDNINCSNRLLGNLELFVSRDALNIKDFGPKVIETLVEKGFIKSFEDIYSLEKYSKEISDLKGFGLKKVDKILKSIENSKSQSFENVLTAIGILNVGKKTAKDLAEHFKSIDKLISASETELLSIPDIGLETASSIIHFFHNQKNLDMIEKLKSKGLCFEIEEKVGGSDKLKDLSFVITGTLDYDRNWYKDLLELHGGSVKGSVSKKTSVVIIGEDAGSKEDKARELKDQGFPIILLEGHDAVVDFLKEKGINIE